MCAIGSDNGLVCWGAGSVIPYPSAYWPPLTVWNSDLSPQDLGMEKYGCDNTHATVANHCTGALTDDDFVIDGVNYAITKFYFEPAEKDDYLHAGRKTDNNLYITFDQALPGVVQGYSHVRRLIVDEL